MPIRSKDLLETFWNLKDLVLLQLCGRSPQTDHEALQLLHLSKLHDGLFEPPESDAGTLRQHVVYDVGF